MIITRIGRSWLLLAALVTVTASCDDDGIFAPTPVDPEPKNGLVALVTLVPRTIIYSVGENVVTDVRIANATNVRAVAFALTYNPEVMQYVNGVEGTFMNSDGSNTVFFVLIPGAGGEITVLLAREGGGPGASGTGVLAMFEFLAVGTGDSGFAFTLGRVWDPQGQILPAQFSNPPVRVVP